MPALPQVIGPYTITREIGRGGMGVVYLAHDPKLARDVAIKVLPDSMARDKERVARFEREAKLLASPNWQPTRPSFANGLFSAYATLTGNDVP